MILNTTHVSQIWDGVTGKQSSGQTKAALQDLDPGPKKYTLGKCLGNLERIQRSSRRATATTASDKVLIRSFLK